jgi:hypothetical protein
VGGWFLYSSTKFPDTLSRKTVPEKTFKEDIPVEDMEKATERAVSDAHPWTAPSINNKAVPLFKSVLLVYKDDQIIDMFLEDPQIRPPLTNKWLRENHLKYTVPNVAELDPDSDGFNNLEEFNGKTDPNDPNSHPPITDKLFLVQRIEHKFLVTLKSSDSPPYQVSLVSEDGKRTSRFVEIGKAYGPPGNTDRFVATKFEKKEIPDPRTTTKDVSELTVHDNVRKNDFVLVKDVETNLADYEAMFEFRLKVIETIKARKGDSFRIPGHDETTYRVIDIMEEEAVIAPLKADGSPGPEIRVKHG